jgi:hypothetical protein
MVALSASDLLHLWEWGQGQPPPQRALAILAAAHPAMTPQRLADLSIGQRDGWLLRVRSHTFGPQMQAVATCPACGTALEFGLPVDDITVAAPDPLAIAAPASTPDSLTASPPSSLPESLTTSFTTESQAEAPAALRTYTWHHEDYRVTFRLPTTADLLALGHIPPEQAQGKLLRRCLQSVRRGDSDLGPGELPGELWPPLAAHLAEQDPQADVLLNLCCPACGHQWTQLFDILSFLWSEIAVAAQRLLRDIHRLASVYGWGEAEILALGPARRSAYLQLIAEQWGP